MNIKDDIQYFLNNEDATISKQWCDEALKLYPYFTLPAVLYLQRNKDIQEEERNDLLARVAISSSDRNSLYDLVGENADVFASFYPEENDAAATPTTENTIDTFLNTFGSTSDKELEILNNLIFNPVPDYADVLAAEEQQSMPQQGEAQSENESLINQFITKAKEQEGHFPTTIIKPDNVDVDEVKEVASDTIEEAEAADESMFSESLAKIYIKQRKYSKALEIITNISQKWPEKSIYYADQIRFLRKLILNEQIKNSK